MLRPKFELMSPRELNQKSALPISSLRGIIKALRGLGAREMMIQVLTVMRKSVMRKGPTPKPLTKRTTGPFVPQIVVAPRTKNIPLTVLPSVSMAFVGNFKIKLKIEYADDKSMIRRLFP
jgi:hypothetical protein